MNRLQSLLARNRHRGEFRAAAGSDSNTIWLYDQIVATEDDAMWWGGVAADSFARSLLAMSGPVTIRVNSPGGDTFAGKAMAQAIRDYPDPVTVQVDGLAASAATFITSAATRTVMAPGSMLMIHKSWTLGMGNADDFTALATVLNKVDASCAANYAAEAKRRGVMPCDFAALMAAETWLTDEEAVELGLADEVIDVAEANEAAQARARWDLSAYARAPQPSTSSTAPAAPAEPEQTPAPAAVEALQMMRAISARALKNPA